MKQGSAFPYISYAVARRARIGFSLMTHCLCHERGTRFSAVPVSTPNIVSRSSKSDESDSDGNDDGNGNGNGNGVSVNQGSPPITTRSGRRVRPPNRMNSNYMRVKELNAMKANIAQALRKKLSSHKLRAGVLNHQFISSVKWTQLKSLHAYWTAW
jgi:hypothetical protein